MDETEETLALTAEEISGQFAEPLHHDAGSAIPLAANADPALISEIEARIKQRNLNVNKAINKFHK